MIHLSKKTRQLPDRGTTLPFMSANILPYLLGQNETLTYALSMPRTTTAYDYGCCCTLSNTTGATTINYYDTGNSSINTGKTPAIYNYDDICALHQTESRSNNKATYADSKVYYYGYRYYSPELGRWPSRDPIGEWGGMLNTIWLEVIQLGVQRAQIDGSFTSGLPFRYVMAKFMAPATLKDYLFVQNAPVHRMDHLGLRECTHSAWAYNCGPCNKGDSWGKRQKDEKDTDGCSFPGQPSWKDNPTGISGCSFLPACDNHDCCYGTCHRSKLLCDANFYSDLIAICSSCTSSLSEEVRCGFLAYVYYFGVFWGGLGPFNENQKEHCEDCCCPGYTPPPPYSGGPGNRPRPIVRLL